MSLALVFATIDRPHVAQRIIASVRQYFPQLPVYVADQTDPTPYMEGFYRQNQVNVTWMPHDSGVCASRNAAVSKVVEDYFILCDDDFVLTDTTDFDDAIKILDHAPEVGVVGGRLRDFDTSGPKTHTWMRYWEMYFQYDIANKLLITVPIHQLAPRSLLIAGVKCFPCDAVMNFAVFRRAIFTDKIQWDPIFKSNGEHEDFYLNLKVNSKHQVIYLPSMIAEHHHPQSRGYARLRKRTHGWALFMKKWGLEQHWEMGLGIRTLADVDQLHREIGTQKTLFQNDNLDLSQSGGYRKPSLSIAWDGSIMPSHFYDGEGNNSAMRHDVTGRFSVGMSGEFKHISGSWHPVEQKNTSLQPAEETGLKSPLDECTLTIKYPPVIKSGDDLQIFAMQTGFDLSGVNADEISLVYSLHRDGQYILYMEPISHFKQMIKQGQWNSMAIPMPNCTGLITFEFHLIENNIHKAILLASGDLISTDHQSTIQHELVTSWSPSPVWRKGILTSQNLEQETSQAIQDPCSMIRFIDEQVSGHEIYLLNLTDAIQSKSNRSHVLTIKEFPYRYGACRQCNNIIADGNKLLYLIPFSSKKLYQIDFMVDDISYSIPRII